VILSPNHIIACDPHKISWVDDVDGFKIPNFFVRQRGAWVYILNPVDRRFVYNRTP